MFTINCFLDSNIILGLIFEEDSLNNFSNNIFSKTYTFIFSTNVKEEVNKIFRQKQRDYKNFFYLLNEKLKKYDKNTFINESALHNMINEFGTIGKLTKENMHNIIKVLWKNYGFGEKEKQENILLKIKKFNKRYRSKHIDSRYETFEKIEEINNHKSKDQEILEQIEKENLRELLHEEDEDILFDLNEYAKEHPQLDSCLVSGDDDFIEAVKILLNGLSFKKYIGRHESNTKW